MSYERLLDPGVQDPERRAHVHFQQIELPLDDQRVTPVARGWVTDSYRTLAKELRAAADRLEAITDEEYFKNLDAQYTRARKMQEVRSERSY